MKSFEAKGHKPMKGDVLTAALAVYEGAENIQRVDDEYKQGVRSAVRQLMVRLGLYDEFCECTK